MFEGLPPTVIDAVTLRHMAAMRSSFGVAFSLITVACTPDILRRSQARLPEARKIANCEIDLLPGYRPSLPGSVWLNARALVRKIGRSLESFDFIHARTDYSAAVAAAMRRTDGPRVIWDCRGDARAEIDDVRHFGESWQRWLLAPVRRAAAERHSRAAARAAGGAIFVSEALRRRHGGELRSEMPVLVTPNCADEEMFFVSSELRERSRASLGVSPREVLFIYCGGTATYQRIADTMRWFAAAACRMPACRLLIVSPERDTISAMAERLALPTAPIIRSAAHGEVNAYLNAADAAFMLRHRNATNLAASPTKFAEYCLTGLPIVMNDAVEGAYAAARRFGNYVAEDDPDPMTRILAVDRCAVSARAKAELARSAQLPVIFDLYRRVVQPVRGL